MKFKMDITEEVKKTGFMEWQNKGQNAKIYESPDKGKTIYERDFGADPSTRKIVKTSVQQQWNITFNGKPL
jgi:hypothetical protein